MELTSHPAVVSRSRNHRGNKKCKINVYVGTIITNLYTDEVLDSKIDKLRKKGDTLNLAEKIRKLYELKTMTLAPVFHKMISYLYR